MKPYDGHPREQDEECIGLIRSGGAAGATARKMLYLRYREIVYQTIRQMLHHYPFCTSEPNDLLHDSFIVLIRKIESGNAIERSLITYWRGIARHLLLNAVKRDQRYVMVEDAEDDIFQGVSLSAEDLFLQSEARETLLHCFRQLSPRYQQFLVMWLDNYSTAEITVRLHLPNDTVTRGLKYKVFQKLKELIRTGHKLQLPGKT